MYGTALFYLSVFTVANLQIYICRVNAQNGYSALMFAAGNGHYGSLRLVLSAGVDKEAKNNVCH